MRSRSIPRSVAPLVILLATLLLALVSPLKARIGVPNSAVQGRERPDAHPSSTPGGAFEPAARPEIVGPGQVTTAGRLWTKVTNIGHMGNPFPELSSDPGGQWPGSSGVEYLYQWNLWVGAKTADTQNPSLRYHVTDGIEWRPPSLDPVDRIYRSYDGEPGGIRDLDDDHDGSYDEDEMDGRDNDGDGAIDEDFAAISQQWHSLALRDDTPQSLYANPVEAHTPLGLQVQQHVLAFSAREMADVVAVEYRITNVSGNVLDSVYVGFFVDQDIGPVDRLGYWTDDIPEPRVPQQDVDFSIDREDPRYDPRTDADHPAGFCVRERVNVRGFSMRDDDGDDGRAPGISSFLLLDHTTDLRGRTAPRRVGFHAFRFVRRGAPANQGGFPILDADRYQTLSDGLGVDPGTGRITAEATPQSARDDYGAICSVGPFLDLGPGASVSCVVALAVSSVDFQSPEFEPNGEPGRDRYRDAFGLSLAVQKFYLGRYETPPPGVPLPPERGWESAFIAPPGMTFAIDDCHTDSTVSGGKDVTDSALVWVDLDCDACTGPPGMLPKRWVIGAPPPNPSMRRTPADRSVTIEWDNRSEVTPDRIEGRRDSTSYYPGLFDFWGYQVWRAAGYKRPPGSIGPSDDLWELVAEFALYDAIAPLIDSLDTDGDGRRDSSVRIAPVLLDRERGRRLYPVDIEPEKDPLTGDTLFAVGLRRGLDAERGLVTIPNYRIPIYPVGRYGFTDTGLLNGFVYFYAIVAVDSTGAPGPGGTPGTLRRREGSRVATEAEGVIPQAKASSPNRSKVYVVPNPYRGSAPWDLTPSAADPTGTHVDFLNMPPGPWTLRIFTISGDLVEVLRHDGVQTNARRQQETSTDGQATWNLISRNGQDVASGIYLFSVESQRGIERGRFVIIR